ncbi:CDP-glycerol glycerophosphotransferase family protein, partial [Streptomyces sp. T-3]|nr:CDP-glycerol glycerophosphotransferase family protein [Streptomyces sp. T-3]
MIAPRLTVVIPMYNVETYLEECLASVAAQTLTNLDVVMVDDGSTDDTARIAAEYAAADPRFRLVRQPNAGLGAARNTGVRHAHPQADYLGFLDSDDIVPVNAYELCVKTLDKTGSDFVSGNVFLLDSTGTRQSPMHRPATTSTKLKTHITKDKSLIADRLAPNKIFRRSFWDAEGFAFPEGVLYEDTPLTVPAHFRAKSVDILKYPTYYWRQREGGGPSITQRRTETKAVRDRIGAVDSVSRFLAGESDPQYAEYKRWYDKSALVSDIRIFINVLPEADGEFRALFMDRAADFLSRIDPAIIEELPALMRLKWHLIANGHLEELLEVLAFEKQNAAELQVAGRLRKYARYPFYKNRKLRIPKSVFELRKEIGLRAKAKEVVVRDDQLHITGHAYLNHLGAERSFGRTVVLAMRHSRSGKTRAFKASKERAPEVTARLKQVQHSYDESGFSCSIPLSRFKTKGKWREGVWRFNIGLAQHGQARRGGIGPGVGASASHPDLHYVSKNVRLVPMFVKGKLQVKVEVVRVRITGHRLDGDHVELSGVYRGELPAKGQAPATLRIHHLESTAVHSYPLSPTKRHKGEKPRTQFKVRVPLADLRRARRQVPADLHSLSAFREEVWRTVLVVPGRKNPVNVVIDDDVTQQGHAFPDTWNEVGAREFVLTRNAPGHLLLHDRVPQPVIDSVRWTAADTLVVEGEYQRPDDGLVEELALSHEAHYEKHVVPMMVTEGRFTAHIRPDAVRTMAGTLPLRSGKWNLAFSRRSVTATGVKDPNEYEVNVRVAPRYTGQLPLESTLGGRRYELNRRGFDRFYLNVHSRMFDWERGQYRQKQLREEFYPHARTLPLRNAVFYDSYSGKQFSDSARAVYEEFKRRGEDVEHLWLVRDDQVELPADVKPVRLWGEDYYEALARSKYIITNAHLPDWIQRRDGQVIVQAWHGTPLKRIGWDIEDVQFANGNYLEKVARESKSWSFLVSPNRFSTPILRRAMRYEGELLEAGYPRNDVLYAPDRDRRAAAARARIGL